MKRPTLVLLGVLALAAGLRLFDLGARGVGHIEMYVPNIPLPPEISDPPPRLTLFRTLTGSLWEVHPPAWYLLNWPWTKAFGTSPTALRLPSALFGILSVGLLWSFARRERSAATAGLTALFLAANGLHVMWSQIARPVVFASTLGLASSLMLLGIVGSQCTRARLTTFIGVSLLGLCTEYYYWPLFGSQMVWVFLVSACRHWPGGLLRWQFLTLILASPLVTLAVAQSRPSYLESDGLGITVQYLGFGFLLGPGESSYAVSAFLPALLIVAGTVFAVLSLIRPSVEPPSEASFDPTDVPRTVWWMGVAAATLAALAGALVLARYQMAPLAKLLPTAAVPAGLALVSMVPMALLARRALILRREPKLSAVLCFLTPATVVAISTFVPFIDTKYFLLFTPFLLTLIADGIAVATGFFHGRLRTLFVTLAAAALLLVHVTGYRFYRDVAATPVDYRELARQMTPLLKAGDRVMVFRHWAMTPIFYYLPVSPQQYVGHDHAAVMRDTRAARFWVISLRDTQVPDPPSVQEAVAGCVLVRTLLAQHIRAELFEDCQVRSERS